MTDAPPPEAPPTLVCPLCRGTAFEQEESRQDSRWGLSTHVMTLMICRRCSYVLHFYERSSYFVP